MKSSVSALLTLSAFFVLTTCIYAQETYSVLEESRYDEPVLGSGVLTSYKTFVLNRDVLKKLKSEAYDEISLRIPSPDGGTFEAKLHKRNIHSEGFSVNTPTGKVDHLDMGVHYGGQLADDPHSFAAFSFFDQSMVGLIATDAGNYNVVFLRDENKNPSNRYVVYNDQALTIENPFHCATDDLPEIPRLTSDEKSGDDGNRASTCKTVTQYYECDRQMYVDNGSNVQNTVNWVAGMFNVVNYLYYREQLSLKISEVYVWTTADNYPSTANGALKAFGDRNKDAFNGNLGHLLSTRNLNNGGLAWLDVLCADYLAEYSYGRFAYSNIKDAYSNLPLWSWTINCVTHETGHNLGSHHTHWCGWELAPGHTGPIDSCYTTEAAGNGQCYTGARKPIKGTIMSYCHLGLGTNLNLGFGPLPGNTIRQRVENAGCIATGSATAPVVTGKTEYCIGERIELSATADQAFTWTGPNGFTSTATSIAIPSAGAEHAGIYQAVFNTPDCMLAGMANVQVNSKPPTPQIVPSGNQLKCIPSSTTYTYQWYSAAGNPVGTGEAIFTPSFSGEYYVVIARNGCESGQSGRHNFNLMASIGEVDGAAGISLWPNPSVGEIFVNYPVSGTNTLSVYDLNGRTVLQQVTGTGAQLPARVDVNHLSNGMYILEVRSAEHSERLKFLVKK